MSFSEKAKDRYVWFKQREGELEQEAQKNGGRLARLNWWRYSYYKYPYLLLETDDAVEDRFVDVFSNGVDITLNP